MLVVSTNSTHPITHLLFSPDGSVLATAQLHTGITLLDRASGQILREIPIPRVAVYNSLCFCSNGELLAVSTNRGIFLVNIQTHELIKPEGTNFFRIGFNGAVLDARNNGLVITDSFGRYVLRASAKDGMITQFGNWEPIPNESRLLGLSLCGRWGLLGHSSHRPRLFDLNRADEVATVDHPFRISQRMPVLPRVTFAPNSSRFAVCDTRDVSVYETPESLDEDVAPVETDKGKAAVAPLPKVVVRTQFQLERPEGVPPKDPWHPPVAFSPEGRSLFVKRPRNRVQMWDVATGCQTGEWSWRMDGVLCLAVAPDGLTAATGARFGRIVMWDLD